MSTDFGCSGASLSDHNMFAQRCEDGKQRPAANEDRREIVGAEANATALNMTQQWLATWRQTGDLRHLDTALACQAIARQHLVSFQAEMAADLWRRRSERKQASLEIRALSTAVRASLDGMRAHLQDAGQKHPA